MTNVSCWSSGIFGRLHNSLCCKLRRDAVRRPVGGPCPNNPALQASDDGRASNAVGGVTEGRAATTSAIEVPRRRNGKLAMLQ